MVISAWEAQKVQHRRSVGRAVLTLASCSAPTPRSPLSPPFTPHVPAVMVTSEQANRIAYDIVKEVGYTPTKLTLATPERPGLLEGTRLRSRG